MFQVAFLVIFLTSLACMGEAHSWMSRKVTRGQVSANPALHTIMQTIIALHGGKSSTVTEISGVAELTGILRKSPQKLVVIDFSATWCGPCQKIAPFYEKMAMSKEYKDVIFLKVDVDEASDVAEKYKVAAMPTFVFLKGGKEVGRFAGASVEKLQEMLEKHM